MRGSHGKLIKLGIEPLMTTEEVAKHFGVSRSIIQRLEKRALRKLLDNCKKHGIKLGDLIND